MLIHTVHVLGALYAETVLRFRSRKLRKHIQQVGRFICAPPIFSKKFYKTSTNIVISHSPNCTRAVNRTKLQIEHGNAPRIVCYSYVRLHARNYCQWQLL